MSPGTVILSYGLPRSLVILYVFASGALLYAVEDAAVRYGVGTEFLRFLLTGFLLGGFVAVYEAVSERYVRRFGLLPGQAVEGLRELEGLKS